MSLLRNGEGWFSSAIGSLASSTVGNLSADAVDEDEKDDIVLMVVVEDVVLLRCETRKITDLEIPSQCDLRNFNQWVLTEIYG